MLSKIVGAKLKQHFSNTQKSLSLPETAKILLRLVRIGQSDKGANRIWFATKDEAEKAGYEPAANCKGLK